MEQLNVTDIPDFPMNDNHDMDWEVEWAHFEQCRLLGKCPFGNECQYDFCTEQVDRALERAQEDAAATKEAIEQADAIQVEKEQKAKAKERAKRLSNIQRSPIATRSRTSRRISDRQDSAVSGNATAGDEEDDEHQASEGSDSTMLGAE